MTKCVTISENGEKTTVILCMEVEFLQQYQFSINGMSLLSIHSEQFRVGR